MMGQTILQQKIQIPLEPTPRDDSKKVVSDVLKRVDQLIRKGDLDHAQLEIKKAKEVDPRNVYAFALEERISILKAEFVRLEETRNCEEANHIPATGPVSKPELQVKASPNLEPTIAAVEVSTPSSTPAPLSPIPANNPTEKKENRIQDHPADLETYKQALIQAWCDGAITENEEQQLSELRKVLEISKSESEKLEKKVKYECYQNALLQQLSDKSIKRPTSKILFDLQRIFHISNEEHLQIETQLMNTLQKKRDKILVIDDDIRLLELLVASLEDNGFDVTALPTSDEAFTLLRKFVPDLILCDINLETSTMGGFTFFEKVQELKKIQGIPFIFLTGLTDEALVRSGKELGADDYLMKPISEQTLVSTLRGKIKRFRQLNRIMSAPLPAMAAA